MTMPEPGEIWDAKLGHDDDKVYRSVRVTKVNLDGFMGGIDVYVTPEPWTERDRYSRIHLAEFHRMFTPRADPS